MNQNPLRNTQIKMEYKKFEEVSLKGEDRQEWCLVRILQRNKGGCFLQFVTKRLNGKELDYSNIEEFELNEEESKELLGKIEKTAVMQQPKTTAKDTP